MALADPNAAHRRTALRGRNAPSAETRLCSLKGVRPDLGMAHFRKGCVRDCQNQLCALPEKAFAAGVGYGVALRELATKLGCPPHSTVARLGVRPHRLVSYESRHIGPTVDRSVRFA